MSVSVLDATYEPRSISLGPTKIQFVELVINSGATSGTVTADHLKEMYHILLPGIESQTAAPTFSSNVATLAFTVPSETAASLLLQSLTYTAVANLGSAGNNITIQYANTAVAGSETVTVTGNAIVVGIQSGVSTRTQVATAINASLAALALVSVSGSSASAATTVAATPLAGGISGGFRGTAICVGR